MATTIQSVTVVTCGTCVLMKPVNISVSDHYQTGNEREGKTVRFSFSSVGKHQLWWVWRWSRRLAEELEIAAVSLWLPTKKTVHSKSKLFLFQISDANERGQGVQFVAPMPSHILTPHKKMSEPKLCLGRPMRRKCCETDGDFRFCDVVAPILIGYSVTFGEGLDRRRWQRCHSPQFPQRWNGMVIGSPALGSVDFED